MPQMTPIQRRIAEMECDRDRAIGRALAHHSAYNAYAIERDSIMASHERAVAELTSAHEANTRSIQPMPTLRELLETRVETNTVEYGGVPVIFDSSAELSSFRYMQVSLPNSFDVVDLSAPVVPQDIPLPPSISELAAEVERLGNMPHSEASYELYKAARERLNAARDALSGTLPASEPEPEPKALSATVECIICGEHHDRDTMETVIDMHGDRELASGDCISNADDYIAPDYITWGERHHGITYFHTDQVSSTPAGVTASEAYSRSEWFASDDGDWYESYSDSPEGIEEREEEERENGDMYDYDKDVLDVHGWPDATPVESLCFGVELECESRNENSHELTSALGGRDGDGSQYILKSDGSIDYGTEIVTLPYTLDYHQARFNWAKVLAPTLGIANSGANTTQCGIHIHINRAAVSALTLGKMLVFVNDPRNIAAITGIAQRSECGWSKFQTKKLTDGVRGKDNGERYQALNVKDNTIEVRIFRGNLRAERVLKNLEFCHALVMYCRVASMQHLTWEQFWQWLRSTPVNRKQYGHLIDFAHGLLQTNETETDKDI